MTAYEFKWFLVSILLGVFGASLFALLVGLVTGEISL